MNHKEAVRKRPSPALPSSFVIAAYYNVRLIPQYFGSLVYGRFRPASSTRGRRSGCGLLFLVMVLSALMALAGCAAQVPPAPTPPPSTPRSPLENESGPSTIPRDEPPPHVIASLQLTDQGRLLLEKGQLDDAIRILERAVNLNPSNGENYYYLAEAWIHKKNLSQAREFNHLAGLYLQDDATWRSRVKVQKDRIKKEFQQ